MLCAVDKCYRYDLYAVRLYTIAIYVHTYVRYHDYRANWIKITGCLYKPNCVVVLGVEDDYPVFGLTKNLFAVDSGQVYFEVTKLTTVQYNCHRHLYHVRKSPHTLCIAYNALYIPIPLHCRRARIDGRTCLTIVVKYHIVGTVQC